MRILLQNPDVAYERYQKKQIEDSIDAFIKRHSVKKGSLVKSKLFKGKW